MDLAEHRRAVQEVGYTVVRQALTVAEVERLRAAVETFLARPGAARYVFGGRVNHNPFVLAPDEVAAVVGHHDLARILKAIAGSPIKFAKEVGLAQNMKSGWHKDMRGLATSADESEAPGLFKVLLYLQDQVGRDEDDFSLRVRRGSHLIESLDEGPEEKLFTHAGDAIIMDCRLTHRGQNESPRNLLARVAVGGLRRVAGPRVEYAVTQRVRQTLGRIDRELITILYGRCNHWTDDYIKNSRQVEQKRTPGIETDPPLPTVWRQALEAVEIAS
jgi:hypothetical protein